MIRFSGTLLGAAAGGVILQWSLEHSADVAAAYRTVFWCIAAVAASGIFVGYRMGAAENRDSR